MNTCVTSILSYPISHIAKLRKLTSQQIFLRNTPLFPAYPFFLGTSAGCNLALAAWMIYYFITSQIHQCYSGVTLGIQILACLYVVYQVVIFLVLIASIAANKSGCWRGLVAAVFTIVATAFGFGGLGAVYVCIVHTSNPLAIPSSFLTQNYFIQILIYTMLVFIIMYILLVPLTTWLQTRRDPTKQRDGCECFLYVLNIFFQFLLFVGMVVFVAIVLGGVPVMFYLLNGIVKAGIQVENVLFGLIISCLVSPVGVGLIVLLFSKIVGCGGQQQAQEQQLQVINTKSIQNDTNSEHIANSVPKYRNKTIQLQSSLSSKQTNRQILLQNHQSKDFAQQQFMSKKNRPSKINSSANRSSMSKK